MTTTWDSVTAALAEGGWQARVVVAERLDDLRERVARTLNSGALPEPAASHLAEEFGFALPEGMAAARSVVVGAVARPLTQATPTVRARSARSRCRPTTPGITPRRTS